MNYQELTPGQTIALERERAKITKEVERINFSIDIGETLTELKEDPRYIKVFTEYYLKDEVVRETMLLSEKYFLEADQRQSLLDGLIAKAHFNDWTTATTTMKSLSEGRLKEHDLRLKEIHALLTAGVPMIEAEVTPPEGVPNVR